MSQHLCEIGYLSRSDGSSLYCIGGTVVLASVNGPGDVKASNRHYNRTQLDVCYSPSTGQSMIGERALESVISKTIEQAIIVHLHPRTAINVTLQEMQSDGLALSTSINAACLALLDAGVQMKSTFSAVTCCIASSGAIILEPTEAEIKESSAVVTFVFDGLEYNVLSAYQDGSLDSDTFNLCLIKCQLAAKDITAIFRKTIEDKHKFDKS
ncbi:Exosome component 5 [Halocaridina rubra]|uniref:Exosome component 5 n=1 Tax=Halocaridina rubra TaxID=373956 RepID=A0AAN8ZYS5_HALRR